MIKDPVNDTSLQAQVGHMSNLLNDWANYFYAHPERGVYGSSDKTLEGWLATLCSLSLSTLYDVLNGEVTNDVRYLLGIFDTYRMVQEKRDKEC